MTDVNLLGRIYPNETEVKEGKAGHIELYHCNECGAVTQFPRYNAAKFGVENIVCYYTGCSTHLGTMSDTLLMPVTVMFGLKFS